MPTDDLPELDTEQVNRIKSMAESGRYLKSHQAVDSAGIIGEV